MAFDYEYNKSNYYSTRGSSPYIDVNLWSTILIVALKSINSNYDLRIGIIINLFVVFLKLFNLKDYLNNLNFSGRQNSYIENTFLYCENATLLLSMIAFLYEIDHIMTLIYSDMLMLIIPVLMFASIKKVVNLKISKIQNSDMDPAAPSSIIEFQIDYLYKTISSYSFLE